MYFSFYASQTGLLHKKFLFSAFHSDNRNNKNEAFDPDYSAHFVGMSGFVTTQNTGEGKTEIP